jgi:hypothetical protein
MQVSPLQIVKKANFLQGLNGAGAFFSDKACQSIPFSQIWFLTSLGPFNPRRFAGFL